MNMAFTLRMNSARPGSNFTILADRLPDPSSELPTFVVALLGPFNRLDNPVSCCGPYDC